VTIPLHVVAPAQPGAYEYHWAIVRSGAPLADADPSALITVAPCIGAGCVTPAKCPGPVPSVFVAEQAPPPSLAPGQALLVSETFANCSGQPWSAAMVQLGAQFPQDAQTWGTNRIPLPADVPSGSQVTVAFVAHAPQTPGAYGFQWEMVQPGVTWIKQMSPGHWITVGPALPVATFDWTHSRAMYNFVSPTQTSAGQLTQLGQLADSGMNVSIAVDRSGASAADVFKAVRANAVLSRYKYMISFPWLSCPTSVPVADCRPFTDWIDNLVQVALENADLFAGYYTFDEPGENWNGCGISGAYQKQVHDYIRSRDPDAVHRPVAMANTLLLWSTYSCGASFFDPGAQDIVFVDQYNQNSPTVEDYTNQVDAFNGWHSYGFLLDRVVFVMPSYLPTARGCSAEDLIGFAATMNQAVRAIYGNGWNGLTGYGYFAFGCSFLGAGTNYGIDNCGTLFDATRAQCSQ
jgi:hypothetical protein